MQYFLGHCFVLDLEVPSNESIGTPRIQAELSPHPLSANYQGQCRHELLR